MQAGPIQMNQQRMPGGVVPGGVIPGGVVPGQPGTTSQAQPMMGAASSGWTSAGQAANATSPKVQMLPPPSTVPQSAIRHTKKGSNKVIGFLFSQLASYFGSGVNAAQAFSQLATQTSQGAYRESLAEAARLTAEGTAFSDVMEMYPDLYPRSAVGMIRAGEQAGFLPQACSEVSRLAIQARKMNIWAVVLYIDIISNLFLLWLIWSLSEGIKAGWVNANANPTASGFTDIGQGILRSFLWPFLPLIILTLVGSWYLYKWWQHRSNTERRHRLATTTYPLSKRAQAESMQVLSLVLAKTGEAGLPAMRSFQLAAMAVPNLFFSHKLEGVALASHDGVRLSDALQQSGVVPHELASLAQTAETTGQLPTLMMQASAREQENFGVQNTMSGVSMGCLVTTVIVVATGLAMIVLVAGYASILQPLLQGQF